MLLHRPQCQKRPKFSVKYLNSYISLIVTIKYIFLNNRNEILISSLRYSKFYDIISLVITLSVTSGPFFSSAKTRLDKQNTTNENNLIFSRWIQRLNYSIYNFALDATLQLLTSCPMESFNWIVHLGKDTEANKYNFIPSQFTAGTFCFNTLITLLTDCLTLSIETVSIFAKKQKYIIFP